VGFAPTGKRRLVTAHTLSGHPDESVPHGRRRSLAISRKFRPPPIPRVYNFVNVSIWLSGCEFGDAIEVTLLADLRRFS